MKRTLFAACAMAVALACPAMSVAATQAAKDLSDCLYRNASSADKELLVQWAYVTIARTDAAKKVQPMKPALINEVQSKAQRSLSTLVVQKCSKPTMQLLVSDPRHGVQDALSELAQRLLEDEVRRHAGALLKINPADLLMR